MDMAVNDYLAVFPGYFTAFWRSEVVQGVALAGFLSGIAKYVCGVSVRRASGDETGSD
jgi:hypothetical protein